MLGETIKDFKITARLGQGGWGEVWAAEQQIVQTKVAIKLLSEAISQDARHVNRFFNEARAASKIKHAGITRIFDVGFHKQRAYLVMELLEGDTLSHRLHQLGRLPLAQVIEIGRQIASVLEATHAADIVHRDLKPDNVFLVRDEELASKQRVKVLDFGIAKLGEVAITATGSGSMGTPPYMAPEQWTDAAKADARADIYSLGCMLFELCAGRPPFVAASIGEACTKHLTEAPPQLAGLVPVPAELDALIARMLAKRPEERPTITEIGAAFVKLASSPALDAGVAPTLGGESVPSRLAQPPKPVTTLGSAAAAVPAPPAARKRSWMWAAIAGAVAVAGAVGVYVATHGDTKHEVATAPAPPPPPPPPVQLHEPKLGLHALEELRDPTSSSVSSMHSEALWQTARADFDDAAKQANAPVRWSAARDFADGQIALAHNDQKAALAAFQKAVDRDPTWSMPLVGIAGVQTALKDLPAALAAASKAQRLDPTSWQAVASGARAYAASTKLEEAIQEYRRALALAPKNPVLLAEIALAYHAAHMDGEAMRYGDQALAIDDAIATVHLMRAELALEKGDSKTALRETERLLAISPKNPGGHLARGDSYALDYKQAEAFDEYRHVLELIGDNTSSVPDARLAQVKAALAAKQLPPPRGKARPGMRSTTNTRSRPGCNVGDPLCATDL